MEGFDAVLERVDAGERMPRLGGMARPNGVVIASPRFWAFATVDGKLYEGVTAGTRRRLVQRLPLVRGLARLGAALGPLFRGRGVAGGRERLILLAALLGPFAFYLLPGRLHLVAGALVTLLVLGWMMRGRTLHLHGAEHRAIAAVEERRVRATWEGTARPTRFALRCGTNFAVLVLPVAAFAEVAWPLPVAPYTPILLAMLTLAVTMEAWLAIEGSGRRVARAFLLPGLGLQRITTREPTLDETRVALRAAASVLRRELNP